MDVQSTETSSPFLSNEEGLEMVILTWAPAVLMNSRWINAKKKMGLYMMQLLMVKLYMGRSLPGFRCNVMIREEMWLKRIFYPPYTIQHGH